MDFGRISRAEGRARRAAHTLPCVKRGRVAEDDHRSFWPQHLGKQLSFTEMEKQVKAATGTENVADMHPKHNTSKDTGTRVELRRAQGFHASSRLEGTRACPAGEARGMEEKTDVDDVQQEGQA